MTKQKLKVGLLLDSYSVEAWKYKMIEDIITSNYSQVFIAIQKNTLKKQSTIKKLWSDSKYFIYYAYQKFENKFFRPSPNAFENKNLKSLMSLDVIELDQNQKLDYKTLDVLLNMNNSIIDAVDINKITYGVWSLHHGTKNIEKNVPGGILEVLNNEEETASSLHITLGNNKDIVAYKSFSHTDHVSFNRNRNNCYWKTSSFVPRKLAELHRLGGDKFFHHQKKYIQQTGFTTNRIYSLPANFKMLSGLIKTYFRSIKVHIRNYFYFDQWTLLIKLNSDKTPPTSFNDFKRLESPKDRFWADPFILERDNTYFLFIEELIYKDKIGTLAVIEMDKKGVFTEPKTILKKDYHLSYPFLIEDQGELYMIPETKGNRTIELYKCTDFPYQWEFVKIMFEDIQAVDTTVYKYNNKFWLFTNIKENDGASAYDELFLFHTEDLLSDKWIPHPMNPIVSDVKTARPAGNIFEHEGKIFRPAQNCAKHYGYGMQIREIVTLNEEAYEEKQIQSIYPDWDKDLVSTHTLNHSGGLTIIDALIRRKK